MHPQLKQILVSFIQGAALLWMCFPSALSQNNEQDAACFKSFECGRVTNLSYPFWGGNRSLSCGYPGFELNCNGDVPFLNISSLTYRLLRVDFSTYTLTVARQDLWDNICPEALQNTTLDPVHFEISPDTRDGAITLYYGCTSNQPIMLQNSFNCSVGGVTTVNIFDASGHGPGSSIRCDRSISVPVNRTAAVALRTPTVSLLQEALASGFSMRWSADNENCESCRRSTGTCGYNQDTGASVCDTRKEWRGPFVEVGAPRPPLPRSQPPAGMPSSPPAPAPETGGFNRSNPALSVPRVSNSGVSRRVWIVAGVVIGMVGIVSMVALICYLNRRRLHGGSNLVHNKSIEKILHQHGYLALKRYKHSEIKKITKSFNDKLGQGGYGSVYKGMLPDGCPVAVKVLTEINSDGEEFINEVVSISRTSHVNIVNLLGFCYDGNKRALVYDFMPNKSLDKFISTSAECHLDLDKLYKIAVGVAKGLEYLHTGCSARIVHFDIKPQNILLDEDFCPKISDFGLAKLCKKKQSALSLLGTRGTIGYIAPEIFSRNYGKVSHKSDVYSYGMMVLEMVGANKIVQTEVSQSSDNYFPDKIYELVTRDNTGNPEEFAVEQEEEEDVTRKMILVGFWCIQTSPLDRPLMSKVVEMLEGSVESIEVPPKPVLFTPSLPQHDFSPSLSACTETDNSEQVIANTQTQVLTIV